MDQCPHCDTLVTVIDRLKDGGTMICPLCNNLFHKAFKEKNYKGRIGDCCIDNSQKRDRPCPECNTEASKNTWDDHCYTCSICDTKYW